MGCQAEVPLLRHQSIIRPIISLSTGTQSSYFQPTAAVCCILLKSRWGTCLRFMKQLAITCLLRFANESILLKSMLDNIDKFLSRSWCLFSLTYLSVNIIHTIISGCLLLLLLSLNSFKTSYSRKPLCLSFIYFLAITVFSSKNLIQSFSELPVKISHSCKRKQQAYHLLIVFSQRFLSQMAIQVEFARILQVIRPT